MLIIGPNFVTIQDYVHQKGPKIENYNHSIIIVVKCTYRKYAYVHLICNAPLVCLRVL